MPAESVCTSEYFTDLLDPHRNSLACNTTIVYDKDKGRLQYSAASLNPHGNSLANGASAVCNKDKGNSEYSADLVDPHGNVSASGASIVYRDDLNCLYSCRFKDANLPLNKPQHTINALSVCLY